MRGYLPLIRKVLICMVSHFMLKKDFLLDLSLENSADSYICFWLALLHSVSYFFFLYWSLSSSLCTVFHSISSNIDEVLSINPSAAFAFGNFNVHHKDWLTYSGGTDRPDELSFIFSILHDLSYLDSRLILIVLHFLISYFLLMLVFVLQWLSLHEEIMFLSQFPLTFHQIHNGIPHFIT